MLEALFPQVCPGTAGGAATQPTQQEDEGSIVEYRQNIFDEAARAWAKLTFLKPEHFDEAQLKDLQVANKKLRDEVEASCLPIQNHLGRNQWILDCVVRPILEELPKLDKHGKHE